MKTSRIDPRTGCWRAHGAALLACAALALGGACGKSAGQKTPDGAAAGAAGAGGEGAAAGDTGAAGTGGSAAGSLGTGGIDAGGTDLRPGDSGADGPLNLAACTVCALDTDCASDLRCNRLTVGDHAGLCSPSDRAVQCCTQGNVMVCLNPDRSLPLPALQCATTKRPTGSAVTDFSNVGSKGDWATADGITGGAGTFSGGNELQVDFSKGSMRVSGTVTSYDGFWVGWDCLDLSNTHGISFTISSATALPAALSVAINTDPDSLREFGGGCYDTTARCLPPGHQVTVGTSATPVSLAWTDFSGGTPSSGIDLSKVTAITWGFPFPVSGYAVDVTVDDIAFW